MYIDSLMFVKMCVKLCLYLECNKTIRKEVLDGVGVGWGGGAVS